MKIARNNQEGRVGFSRAMKVLIPILFVLFCVGCKIITEDDVVGSYEAKVKSINPLLPIQLVTVKHIFLENGNYEAFNNGEAVLVGKWKLGGKEVHVDYGSTVFYRIEANGDLTAIASIREGKREVFPKEQQTTFIKTK